MRRTYPILIRLAMLAGLAILVMAGYTGWYLSTPLKIASVPVEVKIPPGTRFRGVLAHLEQVGVSTGGLRLELLARALGRANAVKAGSYEISRPMTPLQLLDRLTSGDVAQAEIRLIEGWTVARVRQAIDAQPDLRHDTRGRSEAELLGLLGATEARLEGLLFPDTYYFAKGASDVSVLRRAYGAMRRHLDSLWTSRAPDLPYRTPYEALIMASIVEKETGRDADRALIAGALVNRLRREMRLQVDPSVIYGLGDAFDGNLRKVHLQTDGPYNTYIRTGLPPTPIALPGLASLRAALEPAVTDALYYVARGDGGSQFSRTLDEHNRAVNKYQRSGARNRGPRDAVRKEPQ